MPFMITDCRKVEVPPEHGRRFSQAPKEIILRLKSNNASQGARNTTLKLNLLHLEFVGRFLKSCTGFPCCFCEKVLRYHTPIHQLSHQIKCAGIFVGNSDPEKTPISQYDGNASKIQPSDTISFSFFRKYSPA
mmetsp:Transcript_54593/g.144258  ORF Transcript_54593/g.144258 Transcript_54593/m.144258 type:complete len:133 (+) Transcript_54593:310-708(+)